MAAPGGNNQVVRRIIDDLIEFSVDEVEEIGGQGAGDELFERVAVYRYESGLFWDMFSLNGIGYVVSFLVQFPCCENFKKDATLKLFKNGMSMSVQKSQVHKVAKLQDGVEIVLG
ncbi:hypothetical protein Tco_0884535 [Tanacetum coccineum]